MFNDLILGWFAGNAILVAPLATAYSIRLSSGRAMRISVQVAVAIQPDSSSRHGTSYFFGLIRLTSPRPFAHQQMP
jgi:hypothetical protein